MHIVKLVFQKIIHARYGLHLYCQQEIKGFFVQNLLGFRFLVYTLKVFLFLSGLGKMLVNKMNFTPFLKYKCKTSTQNFIIVAVIKLFCSSPIFGITFVHE